jgi:hypothetical protein
MLESPVPNWITPATTREQAAEAERRALIMQAVRQHEERLATEMRRFRAEVDHVNNVCDMRTRSS